MKTRRVLALAGVGAVAVAVAVSVAVHQSAAQQPLLTLPAGFSFRVLATACTSTARSTESGQTFPMPEDFDGNVLFPATGRGKGGPLWLLSNHELTQPRPGDFQGDAAKCHLDEQASVDDGDSDAWGSITRITLAANGLSVRRREIITTGLHNLCASNPTPWGTYLTDEEFPFARRLAANDPQKRAGWVWEVNSGTGKATKLTGMGFLSHEQVDYLSGANAYYLSDDQGDWRFIYRFVPTEKRVLRSGQLFGLSFDRTTNTGTWVGPLDVQDPHADMVARGTAPTVNGFEKGEGLVASLNRRWLVFSESASSTRPGRVWRFTPTATGLKGEVLAEGDFGKLSRPDNLRYASSGDLYIMEDNGSALSNPATGGHNEIWVLPRGKSGSENLRRFATLSADYEPTGPWFNANGKVLYLSLQGEPGKLIAVSGRFGPGKAAGKGKKP